VIDTLEYFMFVLFWFSDPMIAKFQTADDSLQIPISSARTTYIPDSIWADKYQKCQDHKEFLTENAYIFTITFDLTRDASRGWKPSGPQTHVRAMSNRNPRIGVPDMPIYEYDCRDCGRISEILVRGSEDEICCKHCGSRNLQRLLSATSSSTGAMRNRIPGPGDTTCCGNRPESAGCSGPGSCCGRGPQ